MVLDVFPKLINTMTVLLCDNGITASHKAFEGFTAIHRLMFAFVQQYPQLSNAVDAKISAFIRDPYQRQKRNTPSLGNFLPLLLISSRYCWEDIAEVYLSEAFDRNVLWICKAHPTLANVKQNGNGKNEHGNADWNRLKLSFEAVAVSLRLLMFNVAFLKSGKSCSPIEAASLYDQFFGRPSSAVCDAFQQQVREILGVTSWPQFFAKIYVATPSPARMSQLLEQCVRNSLRKRYHREDTVFTNIHKSGVSKILQKGQSYTTKSHIKKVCFQDAWGWAATGSTQFLDASVLLYDKKDKFLEFFDFARTASPHTPAIVHSGDMLNHATNTGRHVVNIDLANLPLRVKTLVFALSSYTTT